MFALFFSLYLAMFLGEWNLYSTYQIGAAIQTPLNQVGRLITSIFGEFQVTDLGSETGTGDWLYLVSFVLALITSIGIVVLAVKGIKRIFAVFFTFGR